MPKTEQKFENFAKSSFKLSDAKVSRIRIQVTFITSYCTIQDTTGGEWSCQTQLYPADLEPQYLLQS